MKRFALLVIFVAAACGGSDKPVQTPMTGGDQAKEEPKLTPELDAFHAILSPRWHADPGEARMTDTCGAATDFMDKAKAVHTAAAPAGVDATAWETAGMSLSTATDELFAVCGQPTRDAAAFDHAFEDVHNAFHRAMELLVGDEHEHGEHGGEHGDHH